MNATTLLKVEELHVAVRTDTGTHAAVRGINLQVADGETVGLVGESGCGKSMTSLALLGLLPQHAQVTSGQMLLRGTELTTLTERQLRDIRGNRIAMIFQEPMTSLNPVHRIGRQITEAIQSHQQITQRAAQQRTLELLELVRIPAAARRINDYPHQFSGGQRQRVMIAIALACEPELLIADEATTALDSTVQAQILALIDELRQQLGMGVLLISHDLSVVSKVADQVVVMYRGKDVEQAPAAQIMVTPRHPYTSALVGCMPQLDRRVAQLPAIPGRLPAIDAQLTGCSFAPRCSRAQGECTEHEPPREHAGTTARYWRCFNPVAVEHPDG